MSETRNFSYVTIGFATDIRGLKNPFKLDTPFGQADTIGLGNLFAEADEMRERIEALEALVEYYQNGGTSLAQIDAKLFAAQGADDGTAG